ncbi:MAG TPA: hypothetical protein VHR55_03335 [Candidatus Limnocylindria bacterium]|nr:hypothetical protein [Candidatus Limnocylindria bacterium]
MTMRRYGVIGTELDGVFFTEADRIEGARDLGEVKVQIPGQNKDIRAVKAELVKQVRALNGNALVAFKYGQQGNPWYKSLTGLFDHEHWHGSGRAVLAPPPSAEDA